MFVKNKPKISVIIPVYNVKEYIKECVDSVIAQTYSNLEIILIDDGSTDGSDQICDNYLKIDKRVKVYHKVNGGLSDARNCGIRHSTGDYLTFVDSDDIVSQELVSHLYTLLNEYDAQLSICDPIHYFENGSLIFQNTKKIKNFNSDEALNEMFYQRSFLVSVWGKLYERSLFDKIRFPKGMLFEDIAIQYKVFGKCENIVYSDAKLYGYRHREKSITTKKFDKHDCDILIICDDILEYANTIRPKIKSSATVYQTNAYLRVWSNAPKTENFAEIIKKSEKNIKRNAFKIIWDSRTRAKLKLALILFTCNKSLYQRIYPKINRWR